MFATLSRVAFLAAALLTTACDDSSSNAPAPGDAPGSASADTGTVTDSRDGSTYNWTRIGGRKWMSSGLRLVLDSSWCPGGAAACPGVERLYKWNTAMSLGDSCATGMCRNLVEQAHRGICLEGWRVPSIADWDSLLAFVGRNGYPGIEARALGVPGVWGTSGWTDAFAFHAAPRNIRFPTGRFATGEAQVLYWTAGESAEFPTGAEARLFYAGHVDVRAENHFKTMGFPLRCIAD